MPLLSYGEGHVFFNYWIENSLGMDAGLDYLVLILITGIVLIASMWWMTHMATYVFHQKEEGGFAMFYWYLFSVFMVMYAGPLMIVQMLLPEIVKETPYLVDKVLEVAESILYH